MPDVTIKFKGDQVALIVRGKLSPAHRPGAMEQHADCTLSNGAPMGFFGEANGNSGNGVGLRMNGTVYDMDELRIHRRYYVDMTDALAYGVVSTVLVVPVSKKQAAEFDKYWSNLDKSPGSFNLLGGNCSTHASDGFITAGILTDGIPGLDTPDNLYEQLVKTFGSKATSHTGYIGFTKIGVGPACDMVIRPYAHSPKVGHPAGGRPSSGS